MISYGFFSRSDYQVEARQLKSLFTKGFPYQAFPAIPTGRVTRSARDAKAESRVSLGCRTRMNNERIVRGECSRFENKIEFIWRFESVDRRKGLIHDPLSTKESR